MNGIEYIARILKQEGVEWISCYPSNPLIEAAAKESIRPIAFRHERGAVMAADGFSRTSNRQRFGVVAIQAQAGAENAMGGIAQAYADNIPILVLPGGVRLRSNRGSSQFFRKPHVSRVGQTRRSDLSTRRCWHCDAARIPRASQWPYRSSRS